MTGKGICFVSASPSNGCHCRELDPRAFLFPGPKLIGSPIVEVGEAAYADNLDRDGYLHCSLKLAL